MTAKNISARYIYKVYQWKLSGSLSLLKMNIHTPEKETVLI